MTIDDSQESLAGSLEVQQNVAEISNINKFRKLTHLGFNWSQYFLISQFAVGNKAGQDWIYSGQEVWRKTVAKLRLATNY